MKAEPSVWVYTVRVREGAVLHVVQQPNALGEVVIAAQDGLGNMQTGFVRANEQAVYWFDSRDSQEDGKVSERVTRTPEQARAEWDLPHGLHIRALIEKAKAVCDSAPIAPARTHQPH
jgi:hypothetical protein